MCGIVFFHGPRAALRLPGSMARITHRGPDDQGVWSRGASALGFVRLAINGSVTAGHQPTQCNGMVAAVNGEIYNYQQLALQHKLGVVPCDTQVVLPLFNQVKAKVIDLLDGFYSSVLLTEDTSYAYCLRDHVGKKPLFVGRSGTEIFIVSELKALGEIDWFTALPLGCSRVDLHTGEIQVAATHEPVAFSKSLPEMLYDAVFKRMPALDQPLGVFLSGGIDSSLIAAMATRIRNDITFYTLGNKDGPDYKAVKLVKDYLGIKCIKSVELPLSEQLPGLLNKVVYATESFNPSVISNGLATYLLSAAAHSDGIKVVLSGEGADERFGGYHQFNDEDPWQQTKKQLILDMPVTELRRLDLCSMAHSVEARCPFLDRQVCAFSNQLSYSEHYNNTTNKIALRNNFEGVLPDEILNRRKMSFDVGSGIRGMVVNYLQRNGNTERHELKNLWKNQFDFDESNSYFHRYPVFDEAIDKRGATSR